MRQALRHVHLEQHKYPDRFSHLTFDLKKCKPGKVLMLQQKMVADICKQVSD